MAFSYLAITAFVTIGIQFTFFIIAYTLRIDKVTDFAGTINFVVIAVLTFFLKHTYHFRQIVLTAFVVAWGLRLGIFLLLRILAWGEDNRFDDKRENLVRFAVFWILQAVWVWTVSLPVTVVNEVSRNPGLTAQDYIGWVMWGSGVVIEALADQTKLNFKNDPKNKGKWTDAGVWGWSRHPNYFGEILLWWGVFVAATPVLKGGQWAVVAGPVFLTLLLLFVSGIPLLESSADKRHGSKAEYIQYKKQTSPLIPLPPQLYGNLPQWFKQIFLLEFPLYNKALATGEEQLRTDNSSGEGV
ncbi:unnamed protein product [Calypogeia fissa]